MVESGGWCVWGGLRLKKGVADSAGHGERALGRSAK